jgi:hypothetical protein
VSRNSTIIAAAIGVVAWMTSAVCGPAEQATVTRLDIGKNGVGTPPAGFDFQQTGEGEPGRWTVVRDPTAADGFAIEQMSTDQHEDRFPLAIYQPLAFENAEITVRFKIVSGTMLSAGVALSVRNPGSYYAVSASALEQRVDLLLVMNGRIEHLEGSAEANIEVNRWHTLRVKLNDDHFAVVLDEKVLFATYDRTRMKDGRVALWTREDNVTRFDSIEIRPLPDTEWR